MDVEEAVESVLAQISLTNISYIGSFSGIRIDYPDITDIREYLRPVRSFNTGAFDEGRAMAGRTVLDFIVSGAVARVRSSELRLETASLFHANLISQYLYDVIIEAGITEALKIGKKLPDPLFNPWKDANMKYRFVTIWYIEAPIESVCEAIYQSLSWPQWWRNVESVEELALGDSRGIGSVRRYTWKGRLPYRLIFDVCIVHSEPLAAIEGVASGDVEEKGNWQFSAEGAVTVARCEWQVRTTPAWMNLLAFVARPFFKWNHNAVMQQGGEALARMLNARLVEVAHN